MSSEGAQTGTDIAWLDKLFHSEFNTEIVHHEEIIWLIYEATMFYSSMIALILLMGISKFREFNTIRDRVNLASYKKEKTDYLLYRVDDVHWFVILV